MSDNSELVAVIDFETTGLSPAYGARPTEIAITLLENEVVVDRFQSLMNSGVWIPSHIEVLTGITNDMIALAPDTISVMKQAFKFCKTTKLVAHNAAFDKRFWLAEKLNASQCIADEFVCTMLVARRLYRAAQNHKLTTLSEHLNLKPKAGFHRAQVDADVTAHLYIKICQDITSKIMTSKITYNSLLEMQKNNFAMFN
jgi:DNA polymerase III subunit epsilon